MAVELHVMHELGEVQVALPALQCLLAREQLEVLPKTISLGRLHPSSSQSKRVHFETQTFSHPTLSNLCKQEKENRQLKSMSIVKRIFSNSRICFQRLQRHQNQKAAKNRSPRCTFC